MKVLVCVDDTDTAKTGNIEVRGTGKLAALILEAFENRGWGRCHPITRHQLLVHPDIPYTSHNSCMCFVVDTEETMIEELIRFAGGFLEKESAVGSDPGLCVVKAERLTEPGKLISFGYRAKEQVLNKEEAYDLASYLGIHLSEHGGTGQGVIGALAGTGLRLSGNDGRFRGKISINARSRVVTVADIIGQYPVDMVKTYKEGWILKDSDPVRLGDTFKTVLMDGKSVLMVCATDLPPNEVQWQTCTKEQLRRY